MSSLDPLDKELFQRAVDAVCSGVNADEFDSDEKLEAALRCELLSIACLNGVSDPECLLQRRLIAQGAAEGGQVMADEKDASGDPLLAAAEELMDHLAKKRQAKDQALLNLLTQAVSPKAQTREVQKPGS